MLLRDVVVLREPMDVVSRCVVRVHAQLNVVSCCVVPAHAQLNVVLPRVPLLQLDSEKM
jgi:hypothetical protein